MEINGVEINWLGHSGFLIKNSKVIYIDPYNIREGSEKADMILITHSHYDHCSVADMKKIVKEGTRIIIPADCQSKITTFDVPIRMTIVEPGVELALQNIRISTVPSYNIDKHFHPKDEGWIGYEFKKEKPRKKIDLDNILYFNIYGNKKMKDSKIVRT